MVHCEGNKPMTFGTATFKQSRAGLSSRSHNFLRVHCEPCRGRVASPLTGLRPIRSRIAARDSRNSASATGASLNNSFTVYCPLSTVCAVRVTASQRDRQAGPIATEFGFSHQLSLDGAIARSQNFLLREQKREGYWAGELMVDSTLVSDTIAFHHWNGKVDPVWERKAVHHIFSLQLADGGWNIYYGGPAEVNATIKAYLALKLAGVPVTDPRMLRAREVALSLGGVPRMNTFSKLYLALLGLFPWDYVPTIPCEVILIGKWFHVNFWEMSNWSRAMLIPLAIINHFKPTRRPREITLEELFPEGYHER